MSTQLNGSRYHIPETAPGVISGEEVRDGDGPLWALYCMDRDISESRLQQLGAELKEEYIIDVPTGEDIHLIRPAPAASLYQASLKSALETHIRYGNEIKEHLEYFPYGFLVAHDGDWETQGLWIVMWILKMTALSRRLESKLKMSGVCVSLRGRMTMAQSS